MDILFRLAITNITKIQSCGFLIPAGYYPYGIQRNKITAEARQHRQSSSRSGESLPVHSGVQKSETEMSVGLILTGALSLAFSCPSHILSSLCILVLATGFLWISIHENTSHNDLGHNLMTLFTSEAIQPLNTVTFLRFWS